MKKLSQVFREMEAAEKRYNQSLVDRQCAMLDGNCNCPREEGKSFPTCEKYLPTPT